MKTRHRVAQREDRESQDLRAPAGRDRASLVVRPGVFLTVVIASALGAGLVIYWLLRSMHI